MASPKHPSVKWIIDNVLGGTTQASLLLNVSPHAVSMMKARGKFPWRHRMKVQKACSDAGVKYDPSVQ